MLRTVCPETSRPAHAKGPAEGERQGLCYPAKKRIEENAGVFDFTLSDADMDALDALDTTGGTDRARERKWW